MHCSKVAGLFNLSSVLAALSLSVISVNAHAANLPPAISGAPATWVYVGSQYSFRPSASDPERAQLRYSIANKPAWASFSSSTGRMVGTPSGVGLWDGIQIRVSDGTNTVSLPMFSVRAVSRSNVAPTISGSPATTVAAGSTYSFTAVGRDANGDTLRYSISNKPAWASFSALTGILSGTPSVAHVGSYSNVSICTTDGGTKVCLPAFSISVTAPNRAPTISGTPSTSVVAGQAYSFVPAANDADGNTLGFSIQNRPAWAVFNSATGQLSGTPERAAVGSYSNVIVSVSDGKATATLAAFNIEVVAPPNTAPLISGTAATSVNSGTAYSFRPTASDADGDTLTFSIANRPTWASFDTATGQLSGTPSALVAGSYANIVITVSDGRASTALPAFAITVKEVSIGGATLSWTPPTQNSDGSALTDLAGFRIYYGPSATQLYNTIQVANPSASSYVIENLAPGTYYFAVRAYNDTGTLSEVSNLATKNVQ